MDQTLKVLATASDNDVLYIVLIIIGILVATFLLFLIIGFALWPLAGKMEKEVQAEFDRILPFEKRRAKVVEDSLNLLEKENLPAKPEFVTSFRENLKKVDSSELLSRRDAKDSMDFAQLYIIKVIDAYGTSDDDKKTKEKIQDLEKEAEKAYLAYGKKAAAYNSLITMFPIRFINRFAKKHHKEKAFLF